MTNETTDELSVLVDQVSDDPDLLAVLEGYVSLLAARDEAVDDGISTASLDAQCAKAKAELEDALKHKRYPSLN